jgi:hypothetical protein
MTGEEKFGRDQTGSPDRLEVWAKRTGRIAGYVVLFLLALYLLFTYAPR